MLIYGGGGGTTRIFISCFQVSISEMFLIWSKGDFKIDHVAQSFLSAQYKYIEDLLERCYPGAQISLDFTISNILEYFSDIAITH